MRGSAVQLLHTTNYLRKCFFLKLNTQAQTSDSFPKFLLSIIVMIIQSGVKSAGKSVKYVKIYFTFLLMLERAHVFSRFTGI